jgi:hypothetical protein
MEIFESKGASPVSKDTCGKFANGANDTGNKFATGVNTPVANQNNIKLLTP